MSARNTVKSIQDIMRQDVGVDGDAHRLSQLFWKFFLKIIDDQDPVAVHQFFAHQRTAFAVVFHFFAVEAEGDIRCVLVGQGNGYGASRILA